MIQAQWCSFDARLLHFNYLFSQQVLDNPSSFDQEFSFEITFECLVPLEQDLEWKIVYVGSAESSDYDQILEQVHVGPVFEGVHKFVLTSPAPSVEKLPCQHESILGVTVVLVTCTYREQEFVRIGYYVNNEIMNMEQENMQELQLHQVVRTILADKPRVTRFPIEWNESNSCLENMSTQDEHYTPLKQEEHDMEMDASTSSSMDAVPTIVSPPSTQTMEIA